MQNATTVVINCAGVGSRLGMGVPKSLIMINNRPLIFWQLKMLEDIEDIHIVVGFMAKEVIKAVRKVRNDAIFVLNREFSTTQTGFSFGLGVQYSKKFVISLDGDLLVNPNDWKKFIEYPDEVLCVCQTSTEYPVCVNLDSSDRVIGFSRIKNNLEWTGLVKIKSERLKSHIPNSYVYQLIEPFLPMPKLLIQCSEIDTPNDYANAEKWVKTNLF